MHGNTWRGEAGYKIRSINCILDEFAQAVKIHADHDSRLAGIHLELTCDAVAECTGGRLDYNESHLVHGYRSLVDPRLNAEQASEVVEGFIDLLTNR
jgi:3-deoxy-7-phosphoheptulonate synthase